jgi:hypothetical protein
MIKGKVFLSGAGVAIVMSLLLTQTIVPAEAAVTEVHLIGQDTESNGTGVYTTLSFSAGVQIFNIGAEWRSYAPRWFAGIIIWGNYDTVRGRYVSLGSSRQYKTESGILGFDGYDFQWETGTGLKIEIRPDRNWNVYYGQCCMVRGWSWWGLARGNWEYRLLYASGVVSRYAWG